MENTSSKQPNGKTGKLIKRKEEISLVFFDILNVVRGKFEIPYKQWAVASKLPQSRIMEFKKRLREHDGETVRFFHYEKYIKLAGGLKSMTTSSAFDAAFTTELHKRDVNGDLDGVSDIEILIARLMALSPVQLEDIREKINEITGIRV